MSAINFFDKLTEETLGLNKGEGQFNLKRLTGYFKNKSLLYYELRYIAPLNMYRAIIKKTILDFPSNWSDFKDFSKSANFKKISDQLLTKTLVNSLFKNNLVQSLILVNTGEQCFILVCADKEEEVLEELSAIFKAESEVCDLAA